MHIYLLAAVHYITWPDPQSLASSIQHTHALPDFRQHIISNEKKLICKSSITAKMHSFFNWIWVFINQPFKKLYTVQEKNNCNPEFCQFALMYKFTLVWRFSVMLIRPHWRMIRSTFPLGYSVLSIPATAIHPNIILLYSLNSLFFSNITLKCTK